MYVKRKVIIKVFKKFYHYHLPEMKCLPSIQPASHFIIHFLFDIHIVIVTVQKKKKNKNKRKIVVRSICLLSWMTVEKEKKFITKNYIIWLILLFVSLFIFNSCKKSISSSKSLLQSLWHEAFIDQRNVEMCGCVRQHKC